MQIQTRAAQSLDTMIYEHVLFFIFQYFIKTPSIAGFKIIDVYRIPVYKGEVC